MGQNAVFFACGAPMADPNPSLLAYPEFPEPITAAILNQLFTPRPEEIRWVWRISSSSEARLGLLCLLQTFPILGRLPAPEDIPSPIVEYIARRAGLAGLTLATYPKRTSARPLRNSSAAANTYPKWDFRAGPCAGTAGRR